MPKISSNVIKVLKHYDKPEEYYSPLPLAKGDYLYRMSIGERSNGKTYAFDLICLADYILNGRQMALVRRWSEDFVGKRGQQMFDALVKNGVVEYLTKGEWTGIYYFSSRWYLCKYDEKLKKIIKKDEPFCYGFSLNAGEHDKSTSYPLIGNIFFDEFIARNAYLPDEFVLFMNTISTIVRDRGNVNIFMSGNTINMFCPYFVEFGIKDHIRKMEQGTIEICQYANSETTLAIEYCANKGAGKQSSKYFAFDNPKLQMITGGTWELEIYPHIPEKYDVREDVDFSYFIIFSDIYLQCDIVIKNNRIFTYIHRKTTPIKDEEYDIVYTQEYKPQPNFKRKINKPHDDVEKYIWWFFMNDKVFYQDNEVGEVVRNYLEWCRTDTAM